MPVWRAGTSALLRKGGGPGDVPSAYSRRGGDVAYLQGPDTGGHHSWTIEEVRAFEARRPVGATPRPALALLLTYRAAPQ